MFEIIGIFFKAFLQLVTHPMVFSILLIFVVMFIIKNVLYNKTSYYAVTHTPYILLPFDKGKLGEYAIYKYLKKYERNGSKFLFNIYVPKEDSTTTEIDVLMISPKGLFVFESKNYSGWIFGSEFQKNWTQVLPKGRGRSHKEHFFNPIMQNSTHMKHLKHLVGEDVLMHSIIVFSERCTLKEINLKTDNIPVINRNQVIHTVSKICSACSEDVLTQEQIDTLYETLYPHTQVSDIIKEEHIENINTKKAPKQKTPVVAPEVETIIAPEAEPTAALEISQEQPEEVVAPPVETEDPATEDKPLICPKCGGTLVLRKASRGQNKGAEFYGCSNFPKCRYIKQ